MSAAVIISNRVYFKLRNHRSRIQSTTITNVRVMVWCMGVRKVGLRFPASAQDMICLSLHLSCFSLFVLWHWKCHTDTQGENHVEVHYRFSQAVKLIIS